MHDRIDCIVCGLATVDIVTRPIPLAIPLGPSRLVRVERIETTTGGLVSNSGRALAKLGVRTAALTYVGADPWGEFVRRHYAEAGLDTACVLTHPSASTPVTIVLVDAQGERSFLFETGAARHLGRDVFEQHLDLFRRSRTMLYGYYGLIPEVDAELPDIFARVRATGCRTALDVAGDGGLLEPLVPILPHLDLYVPSYHEAVRQTGESEPAAILATYRRCGARGLLGVKLGARGAVLSPSADELLTIEAVPPPGPVIDTTGAGDAFYAGLIAGLLRGLTPADAGRLAAAAGACCVTGLGASEGLRDFDETARLAQLAAAG